MTRSERERARARYWSLNLLYVELLLAVWFIVSYGCGILFVDRLDSIRIGGFKLGFWFAQQGAIYVFVAIIFIYTFLMNRLDRRFEVDESRDDDESRTTTPDAREERRT
ncbi:MAG: DUF4212 domain-containing protein [Phycisphaerales bacterium]